jgi:hypothetical protein
MCVFVCVCVCVCVCACACVCARVRVYVYVSQFGIKEVSRNWAKFYLCFIKAPKKDAALNPPPKAIFGCFE